MRIMEPTKTSQTETADPAKGSHTPAPWHLSSSGNFVRKLVPTLGDGPRDFNICQVSATLDPAEKAANAKLIVSAPNLLNTLKQIAAVEIRPHDRESWLGLILVACRNAAAIAVNDAE